MLTQTRKTNLGRNMHGKREGTRKGGEAERARQKGRCTRLRERIWGQQTSQLRFESWRAVKNADFSSVP